MLVISVVFVVAFSLTAMAFHHWSFSQHGHNLQVARNLAESAAALAVARCSANSAYGAARTADQTMCLYDPNREGAWAAVTFCPARATALEIPPSLNNQASGEVEGYGQRLPPHTAQIISQALVGGAMVRIQALLFVPAWPLALVASGRITSRGGLMVAGVNNLNDYTGTIESVPPEKRNFANVASNNTENAAIELGTGAVIRGNVQAMGTVRLDRGVEVRGEVLQYAEEAPIPAVDIQQYVNLCDSDKFRERSLQAASGTTTLEVPWMTRRDGNLDVNGDLVMQGGLLYVTGDLHVTGAVKGKGAVVVGGRATVDRGADIAADHVVALLSRGDVTLTGQDRAASYVQGVVYSEGNVTARRLTVLGSLITRAPAGSGNIHLEDVNLICAPMSVKTRVGLPFMPEIDDDETIFSAFAYPNPADPDGDPLFCVAVFTQIIDAATGRVSSMTFLGKGDHLTYDQAIKLINDCSAAAPSPTGANGKKLCNSDVGQARMREYFNKLRNPATGSGTVIDLELNKLLKPSEQPRLLQWVPL